MSNEQVLDEQPISPPHGETDGNTEHLDAPLKRAVDDAAEEAGIAKKPKVDVITPEEDTEIKSEPAEVADEHAQPADDADESITEHADGTEHTDAPQSTPDPSLPNLAAMDPPDGEPLPKNSEKAMMNVLRMVKRLKDSHMFHQPVDPVKLNIPTYFDVVKQPMDLGTMEQKVHNGEYASVSAFVADMNLIVSNSQLFNGEDSFVTNMAKNVQSSFFKHMRTFPTYEEAVAASAGANKKYKKSSIVPAAAPSTPKPVRAAALHAQQAYAGSVDEPASVPSGGSSRRSADLESDGGRRPKREIHPPKPKDFYSEDMLRPRKNKKYAAQLRFCQTVLKDLMSKKHESISFAFLTPVDPVALNLPSYFKIVKHPMDLSTIQDKLNKNEYETPDDFVADIRLMFNNCYKFNPEGSPVNVMGHQLEALFDRKWLELPPPASSPPPQDDFFDSDYSDEGDMPTDADLIALNPTIKYLQGQLATLQEQLAQARREAMQQFRAQNGGADRGGRRRGGSGRGGRGGRRKSSFSERSHPAYRSSKPRYPDVPLEITYEMKQELSEKIPELPEKKLRHVVSIIQESMPNVGNEDEIELDMDLVDNETLRKLYHIAVVKNGGGRKPKMSGAGLGTGGKKSKKSKPLTEAEQSRQIEEIQRKIAQFNNGGDAGEDVDVAANDDDSDSDDDSDESSSEEE